LSDLLIEKFGVEESKKRIQSILNISNNNNLKKSLTEILDLLSK
jgi:hypothetical protein